MPGGRATALAAARASAVIGHVDPYAEATMSEIVAAGGKAAFQKTDVSDSARSYDDQFVGDVEFREAVEVTGRKNLIMTALWTEGCLTFPALDALKAGYEVPVVADAVGGTSLTAHDMALRRIERAGGKMISLARLLCELQRDWQRKDTVESFMSIFIETGGAMGVQLSYDRE
jgi:nicotinamidase-related amidase